MKISEVSIEIIKPKDGLVGFASMVVDDGLYIGSIGIMRRLNADGFRLIYPNKKIADKTFNYFYPINNNIGQLIESEVVKKLNILMTTNESISPHL